MHKVERNKPPIGLEDISNKWKKQLNETSKYECRSEQNEWTRFRKSKLGKQTLESLKDIT